MKYNSNSINSVLLRNFCKLDFFRSRNYVVTAYPKTGSTWLTELVSSITGYYFFRNRVRFNPFFNVLHTHYYNYSSCLNTISLIRDPREIICSAFRVRNEFPELSKFDVVDQDFVKLVLNRMPGSKASFVETYKSIQNSGIPIFRFEDLKSDPHSALERICTVFSLKANSELIDLTIKKCSINEKRLGSKDVFYGPSSLDSFHKLMAPNVQSYVCDQTSVIFERFYE